MLIDAQTHTTPHFLAFTYLIGCIFERADLKHIRIVPTLSQCRMREDETCRLIETKQTFLVLHDQVVGTLVIAAFFRFF